MTTETTTIELLRIEDSDVAAITALSGVVKWPHRLADNRLLAGLGQGRIVRIAETVAGVGMWWGFGRNLARIGMIIVHPDHQGRGLGRRLMETLLADIGDRAIMLLATEQGRPLYDTLGFRPVGSSTKHQGPYAGDPVSDPRLHAMTAADLAPVPALDAPSFGADRIETLAALLAAGRGAVLEDGGRITGYAIERDFGLGSVVGPILAASTEDANLLTRALARPGIVTRIDRPTEAVEFGRFLEASGLAVTGDSVVMVRGSWPAGPATPCLYGMASHALG